MTPQELKRELAIPLFQQGKLSFGKAREMADMTVWAFQQLLGSRDVPIHYDLEDYEGDLTTLKELACLDQEARHHQQEGGLSYKG